MAKYSGRSKPTSVTRSPFCWATSLHTCSVPQLRASGNPALQELGARESGPCTRHLGSVLLALSAVTGPCEGPMKGLRILTDETAACGQEICLCLPQHQRNALKMQISQPAALLSLMTIALSVISCHC